MPLRRRLIDAVEAYTLLILVALIALFFTVLPATAQTFPTAANLRILVASQAVIGLIAVGALMPLIVGEFDLSVGAIAGLSAILVAELLAHNRSPLIAVVVGAVVGVAVGLTNGLIVTRLGVSGVITTLGMSTILAGGVLHITGGLAVGGSLPEGFTAFGTGTVLGIPSIFIVLILVAGAAHFLLAHTAFGRELYALGSNPAAAELVGVQTRRIKVLTFLLAGTLCGAAGVLYVARAGGANPSVGIGFTLPALAAAFLSAAAIKPGRFNVWGTLVAIFFLAFLNNGLNLAGAAPYVSDYVNGAALIIGVALAALLHRRRAT
jgi:ribose transport system permease protein